MSGIFISYRREDSAAHAGRLYDRLSAHFGADQVFMDVDDIPPGADFASHIGAKIRSCDAMIVVIGKDWLTARNADGHFRLSDPNDFVGLEVSMALQRGVLVVPALVGGAAMPKADQLRADLRGLAGRNAVTIDDRDFQRDVDKLIAAVDRATSLKKDAAKSAEGAARAELRRKLLRRMIWKVPIIILLVSFAVWWEWRKQPSNEISSHANSTAFTGAWSGEVTYGWGAKYTETFLFQPEGDKLFGTVSFLGAKRGIEEGKIEGESISFYARYEEVSGGESRDRKNYYWGKLNGNEILMRMQDDRGSPAVEWVLKRSGASK
ncbi:MAG TPA: toll/interleukin-1 receptor domain-containing protein [Candidatus Binatia bacterium]|nr:toll/interleukin-1 receptor domain-containing protein [Candidatus Binatia bacterium]